ncbi:MAG: cytochrome d ubiquinol oxidase subunit II [Anaerolineae bacterium]
MSHTFLQNAWYLLIGVLLIGYAILDGFDLGVGVLSPFIAKDEKERRALVGAIGPFWDGNEVWLLTAGGALFAAFPHVYATVFSGFYLALMLVLYALILRAVSFEFGHRVESAQWRRVWDWVFFAGSLIPALLTGVAVGNVMRGVPLDARMEFAGDFFTLLNPFALVVGLAGLAMFVLQGAAYLIVKTNGALAERARKAGKWAWATLVVLLVVAGLLVVADSPERLDNYTRNPITFAVPLAALAFLILTRVSLAKGAPSRTFLLSSLSIAAIMGIWGVANYPYLLPARNVTVYGLTISNASASQRTLQTMFVIALIGMPLVLAYTAYVYWLFRGKVRAREEHY